MTIDTKKIFFRWIPLAVSITLICALVYLAMQQTIRIGANSQQIQIAEDVANLVNNGTSPSQIIPPGISTDISKSLATYIIIYDDTGKAVASTAALNNAVPTLPTGVLTTVRKSGEDRLTWQPAKGVRQAIVVTRYSTTSGSGFILAGQSLRETESLEILILRDVAAGWLVTLALSLASIYILEIYKEKKQGKVV